MDVIKQVISESRIAARFPSYLYEETSKDGIEGFKRAIETSFESVTKKASRALCRHIYNPGTIVWEDDWDVLLILDACRVDMMADVADEYSFLPPEDELETRWSVGSMSRDWLERTFTSEYSDNVAKTAYVSGNAFTQKVDLDVEPAVLDEVWKYGWDEEINTIPPRAVTDRAIDTWRNRPHDIETMIVHYMQPHAPFIPEPDLGEYKEPDDFGSGFIDIWGRLGDDLQVNEVRNAFRDNLRCVLDDVEVLLENLNAKSVAITADHGNAMGTRCFYGHPSDLLHPSIRRVPWIKTTGRDAETYEPDSSMAPNDEEAVEERLRHLGYR